jgi:putative ATP-dependent endonuclease of the OLD family
MISENIDNITVIPNYILEALAFACPKPNIGTLVSIARHRFSTLKVRHYEGDKLDYTKLLEDFDEIQIPSEAMEYFKKHMPKDVLSNFIKLVDA